jgi:predicted RNA binding protein YcfA (HicA-like mRNA interferase family)
MTPKLPVVSGDDLVRVLRKFGYEIVRQKGSHVRLRNEGSASACRSRYLSIRSSLAEH